MVKKLLLMVLISTFGLELFAQLYYTSGTFKVVSAVENKFYPGMPGSPINRTVVITLVMKRKTKLQMDSFWYDGYTDKVFLTNSKHQTLTDEANKGDTVYVTCSIFIPTQNPNFPPETSEQTGSKTGKTKLKHTGKLLFRYGFEKPQYYFSIKNIKQGTAVYAP